MIRSAYSFTQEIYENKHLMRYDEKQDFLAWQRDARNKLKELIGFEKFVKCDDEFKIQSTTQHLGHEKIRFTFQSEKNYYIPCELLLPKSTPKGTVICLQGHSKGMHISLGIAKYEGDEETISGGDRDFAIRAVKEGYAAICLEQRHMGECGGTSEGPTCHDNALASLLIGRCAIGERVWDITRLIDIIQKYLPMLDSENIICLGNSGGGTTTYYAACIDERIKISVPSCSVCTYEDSIVAMMHCACNFIPNIANCFDMGDLGGIIAPRKLIVVNGKNDPVFPEKGVKKSYELIKKMYSYAGVPENCSLVTGDGGHRFYADIAWQKINEFVG